VPELSDHKVGTCGLKEAGQQGEVVVLDEDERRPTLGLFEDGVGEASVDGMVSFPVLGLEGGPCVDLMAHGPERAVGETVVIALLLGAGEPNAAKDVAGIVGRNAYATAEVDNDAVGVAGAVRDPGASAGLHDGVESGGQSASGTDPFDLTVTIAMQIGLAVGDNDETGAFESLPGRFAQSLLCPRHAGTSLGKFRLSVGERLGPLEERRLRCVAAFADKPIVDEFFSDDVDAGRSGKAQAYLSTANRDHLNLDSKAWE